MLQFLPLLFMAAGSAISAAGSGYAAKGAEEAARAQRDAAEKQARNVELQTAENVSRQRSNANRALARLRADYGNSGIVLDGSIEDAYSETTGRLELELQDAARAGAMQAANIRSHGEMAMWEGRQAAAATRLQGYGSLLSSASSMGSYGIMSGIIPTTKFKPKS